MKKRNRNKWLASIIIIFSSIAAFAYYQYNKGPIDVKKASAKKVEAVELYQAYASDSTSAQKNFNGRVVEVSGTIEELSENQHSEKLVLLKTAEEGAFVNCTLEETLTTSLKKGNVVSLKGICNGLGEGEPELGIKADLYVIRAYLNR